MMARFIIILTIVLLFVVTGCSSEILTPTAASEEPTSVEQSTEAPVEETQEPVVLRVGGMQGVDCWNPVSCTAIYQWGALLAEGLTWQGKASEGCPSQSALAESWEISEDGLTWTIKLHEGITFPDGSSVTASTVKEFYEWWASNDVLAVFNAELLYFDSIEVIDVYTFTLTMLEPIHNSSDYEFIFMLVFLSDYSKAVDLAEVFTVESNHLLGVGAYTLTEYVPGSHMIFNAREDYFQGKPPIDHIIYTIYTNPDALDNTLLAGEIDLTLAFNMKEIV